MVWDLLAVRCQPIKSHAGKFMYINMDLFLNNSGTMHFIIIIMGGG